MPLADRNVAKGSLLLPTLAMASMLGMVASSIYVASIPEMALAFGTSVGAVQLSYVGYLAALAVFAAAKEGPGALIEWEKATRRAFIDAYAMAVFVKKHRSHLPISTDLIWIKQRPILRLPLQRLAEILGAGQAFS